MNGQTGKILLVDLTTRKTEIIPTSDYDRWVGGHAMGSALFWDLCKDKTVDGFHPGNVITIMTSPMTGTPVPGGASRTEMQAIGVQSSPIGWYTRSNLGGRLGPMLKYAGFDGMAITGAAEKPVWLDVRDGKVEIRDAKALWGLDTWQTQEAIWKEVCGGAFTGWIETGGGRTSQRPAVLAIGPAGEALGRVAAIIHDAGNAAGQGGFGAVFGAKKLKAVSVIGSGKLQVADPAGLLEARRWVRQYMPDVDDPQAVADTAKATGMKYRSMGGIGSMPMPIIFWQMRKRSRPQACIGCPSGCRARNDTGLGNESECMESLVYTAADLMRHSSATVRAKATLAKAAAGDMAQLVTLLLEGEQSDAAYRATDLLQKLGINAYEMNCAIPWLRDLRSQGALGPGQIDLDLPWKKFGEYEFAEKLFGMVARREGAGDDLAEGCFRAAHRWNRVKDLDEGRMQYPYWGLPYHYDPRSQTEWGYGTILGDRDINEHGINIIGWTGTLPTLLKKQPLMTAEEMVSIYSEKMVPATGDPMMLDYSPEGVYSDAMVKLVDWHRGYTRFWKQSMLFCDFLFPDFFNPIRPDLRGMSGEGEPRFLKAVTGRDISFGEGVEIGRRVFNLDNAIWALQGRHRDQAVFAKYVYDQPYPAPWYMPSFETGKWEWGSMKGRKVDRAKFEDWKTRFYRFQGWDEKSGWPTRQSLAKHGLPAVADALAAAGRLGGER